MSRRLRSQDGMTVIELLLAMFVLGIVIAGSITLMQTVMTQGRGVLERTDANQHGRLALDQMTRQIRSQVCRDQFTGGLVAASANSVTFYTDLGDGEAGPSKHRLTFDDVHNTVTETVWSSQSVPPAAPSYATQEDGSRVILQDVDSAKAANGTTPLPFFTYFAYDMTKTPLLPTKPLVPPVNGGLGASDLQTAAVVGLRFRVLPTGARDDTFAVEFQDEVFFRNADPNAARPEPKCT